MKRLFALGLFLVAVAVAQAQAQIAPSPAPTPQSVTNYNTFHVTLGNPTTGPVISTQTAGAHVCAVVLNYPFSSAFITPQGSDDYFTWHALSTIGKGTITMPGLYLGPNQYKYFRPYFTQFNDPGATGWEACADDESALIAPMLNGQNGVLNNYQQITAIGHPGCAVFDANGNLLPQGGGLPCAGGGGSTCANPPSPAPSPSPLGCVVLQDSPSPTPQLYNDGQGSAAVGGILQGGSLYTFDGSLNSQSSVMTFCANETNGFCDIQGFSGFALANDQEGMDLSQRGFSASFNESGNTANFTATAGGVGFGSSGGGEVLLESLTSTNAVGGEMSLRTLTLTPLGYLGATELDLEGLPSHITATPPPNSVVLLGSRTPSVRIMDSGISAGAAASTLRMGDSSTSGPADTDHFIFSGTFEGGFSPTGGGGAAPWGTCQASASITCAVGGLVFTYSHPACIATVQGSTPIAAACSFSGSTVTITAATSNSDLWAFAVFGAPN